MNISDLVLRMIDFSKSNLHDIDHFLKVYAYARTITENEDISQHDREITQAAAIVHDIACPLCRKKYGNANGKLQETEGAPMAKKFLLEAGIPENDAMRIAFLVGHHHSPDKVDGIDYQILLESDYLVNAGDSGYSRENITGTMNQMFKSKTGIRLLKSIYGIE